MKKITLILSCAMVFGISTLANATLQDLGNNYIYDTDKNITWKVTEEFANTLWGEANIPSGWRLPAGDKNCQGYSCNASEMGHLFYEELGGVAGTSIADVHNSNYALFSSLKTDGFYWTSTKIMTQFFDLYPLGFSFGDGKQLPYNPMTDMGYTLLVQDGRYSPPVPIPAAVWLLGSGLLGLFGIRRKISQ